MRILHVLDTRQLRGAEIFASDLIRALKGTGISQRVCVLRDSGSGRVRYEAPTRVLADNGWMAPGLRVRPQAVRGLRRSIMEWSPDIVQAHGGSTLKYAIPAVLGLPAKVVYRQIGPTHPGMIGPLRRLGHGFLMRQAARVVPVGQAVHRNAVEVFRVPGDRLATISNAVDPRRLGPTMGREAVRRALGIPSDSPVMLSVGALTWEKNPVGHVEIGARVLRRLAEAFHVIVGDGPMRRKVESAIRRRALDGRILLLGARSNVADFMAATDVLLFASRVDGMESMNATVIEAGMLGVPAAAYAVGGVPEIVVDGVTGRLSPAGQVDDITGAVVELLSTPKTARAMGEAARERYLSLYDIRTVAPQYLRLYEDLLS